MERLDKILANTGRWSRKEARELIRAGRVSVDGVTARAPEDKADPAAVFTVDGERISGEKQAGRLDKDTEGLLLLTNDGPLAHRLLSPRHHVDKTYFVRVDGALDREDAEAFAAGMTLADGLACLPAGLELLDTPDAAIVTLREGKYHQIKRMLAQRGKPVVYLKRLTMGPLSLDPALEKGEWRPLTAEELAAIRSV